MISSVRESAASQERGPRERERETYRERERERVVKSKSVLVIYYSLCSAALAGSQKKTSPHYYLIHTRTHGFPVCLVCVQMCICSNSTTEFLLKLGLCYTSPEIVSATNLIICSVVQYICYIVSEWWTSAACSLSRLLLITKHSESREKTVTEETNRKLQQGNQVCVCVCICASPHPCFTVAYWDPD